MWDDVAVARQRALSHLELLSMSFTRAEHCIAPRACAQVPSEAEEPGLRARRREQANANHAPEPSPRVRRIVTAAALIARGSHAQRQRTPRRPPSAAAAAALLPMPPSTPAVPWRGHMRPPRLPPRDPHAHPLAALDPLQAADAMHNLIAVVRALSPSLSHSRLYYTSRGCVSSKWGCRRATAGEVPG